MCHHNSRLRSSLRTLLVLLLGTVMAAVAQASVITLSHASVSTLRHASVQGRGFHVDKRFGFKLKPPKDWQQIPIQADEEWLVAKYLSKKKYFWTEKGGGWTYEHQPELMVIAFVKEITKKEGGSVTQAEGNASITFKYDNPYKNYEDYLDRTFSGGGFYISKREEKKIGDLRVTQLEIKVEKLARGGPKRIIAWVYHTPDVDFAIQVEVLENSYKKLKRTIQRTLGSFKQIERTEGELPAEAGTQGSWVAVVEMDEGTPQERRKKREQSAAQHREKALARLPEGWTTEQMGRVFVISHVDKKYATRIAAQSNAILSWLDDTFSFVGPDEYVRDPIIRICKDSEEQNAYRRGGKSGGGWFSIGLEITTTTGKDSWFDFDNQMVNQRLMGSWFQDRDRDLYWAFPEWLDFGLNEYAQSLSLKGKKLVSRPDDWDKDTLRELIRDGTASSPGTLMSMTRQDFQGGSGMWNRMKEAGALVRFLMSDQAQKKKQTKGVLVEYIKNLELVIAEIEAQEESQTGDSPAEKPKTEEEEEELYKKRRNRWKEREREILNRVFEKTFGDWSERDWKTFEKAYFESID